MKDNKQRKRMASDEAVKKSTGKVWKEWFGILDKAGSKNKSHKDIASWLFKNHNISGWWSQMITVEYEKARGMREKYQRPDDYEISVSKTINTGVNKIYNHWINKRLITKWIYDKFEVSTKTKNKSFRALWIADKTKISVNFYTKDENKTMVVIQHLKLKNSKQCSKMKKYWSERLNKLKKILEI